MGYQTTHKLTIKEGFTDEIGELLDRLLEERDCSYVFEARDEDFYDCSDGWKWYEHEEDMRYISKQLPHDVLLLLEGKGEENGDVWREYYRSGKCARCTPEVTWKEYSEFDLR